MDKKLKNNLVEQGAKVMLVQQHQLGVVEQRISTLEEDIHKLSEKNSDNLSNVNALYGEAEKLCQALGYFNEVVTVEDIDRGLNLIELSAEEIASIPQRQYAKIDTITLNDDMSWEEYLENIDSYAIKHKLDLTCDPFDRLLSIANQSEISENIRKKYVMRPANCDKYDYLIASFCGIASGLIDSFFVGMPGQSKLGNWIDIQTDNFVIKVARLIWQSDKNSGKKLKHEPDTIGKAISFLERRFKINYDARSPKDLPNIDDESFENLTSKNHHLKSLGHSPDIIGLIFSILDQFNGTATFVSNGKIITVKSNDFELQGSNFISKIFCGFCNWIGHIISDLAGSSSRRTPQSSGRGSGIPIPFYELFLFCDFGSFNVNGDKKTMSELMIKVFEEGYDVRFGAAMAIPVLFNELIIRLTWSIKSHYYHKRSWEQSLPWGNQPELRRMLLVGHGALCMVDVSDAAIRSRLNTLSFVLHINIIAWSRFSFAALKEVRLYLKKDCLDFAVLDIDIKKEWVRLYNDTPMI